MTLASSITNVYIIHKAKHFHDDIIFDGIGTSTLLIIRIECQFCFAQSLSQVYKVLKNIRVRTQPQVTMFPNRTCFINKEKRENYEVATKSVNFVIAPRANAWENWFVIAACLKWLSNCVILIGTPNQLKQQLKVFQKSDSTVNISIHANAKRNITVIRY